MSHQVLLFRNQNLDADQQVRFSETFGPVREAWPNRHFPSANSKAHYLTNIDADGRPTGVDPGPNSDFWHSDGSWSPDPARATIMHAVRVPVSGGDTLFADMYGVFDDLAAPLQEELAGLHAVHDVELSRAGRQRRWPWQWRFGKQAGTLTGNLKWWRRVAALRLRQGFVSHPLVFSHPDSGRPALFAGDHAWRIKGMSLAAGIRRMRDINGMEFAPPRIYSHRWRNGDVVVWDNLCVLHKVMFYDLSGEARVMRRCVTLGGG